MTGISILHLTDIHAGLGELVDEDGKVHVPKAQRLKQLDRLTDYLKSLPKPDYVVVSGDITIRGDIGGLETFKAWLAAGIQTEILPPAGRILLVPGNHDVTRRRRASDPDANQFRNFWEAFGKAFPHAHIPSHDPKPTIPVGSDLTSGGVVGGIVTVSGLGELTLSSSQPFLLDLDHDVLIYGFNSAHACGVPLKPDPQISEKLSSLSSIVQDSSSKKTINDVLDSYLDSLVIDAGLITDDQITHFNNLMVHFRNSLGPRYDRLTKIGVLHHHIGHLWGQQLEAKAV
ncbi:metallophosphoesterase family protein [Devosia riboflavina]